MDFDGLIREAQFQSTRLITRKHFFRQCSVGLGAMYMGSMLASCAKGELAKSNDSLAPKAPHFPGKAKSVIYLHMAGSPSQLELFDYKPVLHQLSGKPCPPSLLEGKRFAFIRGVPQMLGPQAVFRQRGESGLWISDNLPHMADIADELTIIKALHTDQFNHAPAQLLLHTGSPRLGRPSMGSWVSYGLGTENSNLPGFVVLISGGRAPDAGKSVFGSGFLPTVYQGVQCRSEGDPVLFIKDPEGITRDMRKESIDAINEVNRLSYEEFKDPETLTRIAQYELAYRMQTAVPDVMDISTEPDYIHQMYGTQPGKTCFANNALLARKMVENGVRFVQLFDWGWDSHGTDADASLDIGLVNKCRSVDKATTALILDLKQRGLLDETLIVWGGEFGRTPMQENREGKAMAFKGRDHHTDAFSIVMAGGGLRKGFSFGETDEIGYHGVKDRVSTFDLQATILNQLGFDHEKLIFEFQGRPFRLTDVEGKVVKPIIA